MAEKKTTSKIHTHDEVHHDRSSTDHKDSFAHHEKPAAKTFQDAWAEYQHKYTQTAKEILEKFPAQAKTQKPDHEAIMKSHKKNLEALNDANKMATDVMKSISNLQGQFLKQAFDDMHLMMGELMGQKPGPQFDLRGSSEILKNSIHRTMDHAKVVGSALSTSSKDIHAKMNSRLDEAKEEFKQHQSKYKH